MYLLIVKVLFLISIVNGEQSCYSACHQDIPFNTTLQPPTTCEAFSNSSLVCAVSVTYYSNQENIGIFYFTPSVSQSRPSFVETEVSLSTGILSVHIFHECSGCNILENTRHIIASMQSIPKMIPTVVSRMHDLFPIGKSTSSTIECYNSDNEKETFNQCQSCLLQINSTSTIRSCEDHINSVGVKLYEKTTLDDKREFRTIYIECVQSRCNTRNTAQAALRILADTGFAQHFYDLSSAAIVFSYSIPFILICVFSLLNTIT